MCPHEPCLFPYVVSGECILGIKIPDRVKLLSAAAGTVAASRLTSPKRFTEGGSCRASEHGLSGKGGCDAGSAGVRFVSPSVWWGSDAGKKVRV